MKVIYVGSRCVAHLIAAIDFFAYKLSILNKMRNITRARNCQKFKTHEALFLITAPSHRMVISSRFSPISINLERTVFSPYALVIERVIEGVLAITSDNCDHVLSQASFIFFDSPCRPAVRFVRLLSFCPLSRSLIFVISDRTQLCELRTHNLLLYEGSRTF
jgi:hypothetical protein